VTRKLLAAIITAAAMLPLSSSTVHAATPQYRALWVDAFHPGMKRAGEVEKLVADARRANVNALIVQVRKRGDAYFNRSIEPRADDIRGPLDFDPLDYLIRLAHSSSPRIEVHAWTNVYFTGQSSVVYTTHGSAWGNKANDGATGGFLDPGVPEVAIYTHRVLMNMVRNYDVDGLHLDFVRYPGDTWGYNSSSLQLYKVLTGVTRTPGPADPGWQAWRRTRVTSFVRDLKHDLDLEKPNVKLSAALICYGGGPYDSAGWIYTSAYSGVFQDWRTWLTRGYLDFGVPMNYDSDWNPQQKDWFDRWMTFNKDSGFANRVVVGVGAFLNYPEDTLAQIRRALSSSAGGNRVLGVAIYSYGSTSVYGADEFYADKDLASGLPRQPYSGGITDPAGLAARGRSFNDKFMNQLSKADSYRDVQLGVVATQPVFVGAAPVPSLG